MGKENYPTPKDLNALLKINGSEVPENINLEDFIGSSITTFERQTGWQPFLASNKIQTRIYPVSSLIGSKRECGMSILELDDGIVEIKKISIASHDNDIKHELKQNIDFVPKPTNATVRGKPYEWIDFLNGCTELGDKIILKGYFGYSRSVPNDVWQAILHYAASKASTLLAEASVGRLASWSEGDVKETYYKSSLLEPWQSEFHRVVKGYKRMILGV